MFQDSCKLG